MPRDGLSSLGKGGGGGSVPNDNSSNGGKKEEGEATILHSLILRRREASSLTWDQEGKLIPCERKRRGDVFHTRPQPGESTVGFRSHSSRRKERRKLDRGEMKNKMGWSNRIKKRRRSYYIGGEGKDYS